MRDTAAHDLTVVPIRGEDTGIPILTATNLLLDKGDTALLDIPRLQVQNHGPTLIMGPNGAGKSLLLRVLHGLIRPTRGQVSLAEPFDQAMVFQRPVLLRRSVAGNVDFVLKSAGIPRRHRKARVARALAQAGLTDLARQSARSLSGGEQQKLALVSALARKPDILFLDEPTSNLDPTATQSIEQLIAQANRTGTKVIMVTHDAGQAKRIGGEVIFMNKGRVIEQTPIQHFLQSPKSDAARHYLAGGLLI
ncbi:ATP-binding cassette domain-containing protein [Pseudaestuariivita rosea]|uniref:ATP-binding cassette domain-containing protein n=1 Tax=Pseudaestuariivita rosea TaxID=2763263 RepID=UPI001ABB3289|nr:ATP-binding cassette domain-containing protein [Pseudaestuariivita rosea]